MARVLIIDDDIDALRIMKQILAKEGYEVEILSHWHESFEKIKSFQPNLILLDILLSGIDGRHISKQLKSNDHTKNIPIILVTATPDIAKNIGDSGADDYIEKPFTIDYLINKIKTLIDHYSVKA
ncbi:MAG: response regulator [Bacteroidota bacterium]|nr:response regulator [Bacteroidota bacterium]